MHQRAPVAVQLITYFHCPPTIRQAQMFLRRYWEMSSQQVRPQPQDWRRLRGRRLKAIRANDKENVEWCLEFVGHRYCFHSVLKKEKCLGTNGKDACCGTWSMRWASRIFEQIAMSVSAQFGRLCFILLFYFCYRKWLYSIYLSENMIPGYQGTNI